MFLKSLYISGFKSFAHPTKIEFSDNISAIIGPNGSGKSNISDAIRFVLGEQRTKLMRSQNMQDIIFSGTDSENPRGVAHVQLILSRDNEPDLVIERKYYRTGESEYLLNGKKVRLKDIHSEFWDTGLGKNGYSIISQGGVESIVGASPNELRSLVEEAVGIAGYKVQQTETLKRLETIEDNIERVSDILDEMQRQLKPLKKSAEKTRQYLKIFNILKDIDLVNFFEKEKIYQTELEELKNNLINSNFSIVDLDKLAEEKDSYYLKIKKERSENEKTISSLKENLENLKQEETNIIIQQNKISTKLDHNNHNIDQFKIRNEEINRIINKDKENLEHLKVLVKEENSKYLDLKKITQKNSVLLENLKDQLVGIKLTRNPERLNKLKSESEQLTKDVIELRVKLDQANSNKKENIKKIKELELERNLKKSDLERKQNKRNDLVIELNKKEDLISEFLESLNDYDKKLKILNSQLQTVNNNLNFENNLKNSYSGFREAVRSVMQYVKTNSINGVYGTVSELFTTDEKFQTAIQIALGNSLQNIIVNNSNTAKKLIDFLKRSKKGRATFLPLDINENNKFNQDQRILNNPGVIGFANNLITTDQMFKGIFDRLLGRTIIFTNYNDAQNFRKSYSRYTLVTLDGECFYSNGSIVGGSINKKSSYFINNRNKIIQLQKQKSDIENQIKTLKSELILLQNKQNKEKTKLNSLETRLKELDNRLFKLESQINLLENSIKDLKDSNPDIKALQKLLKEKESKLNIISNELTLVQEDSSKLSEDQESLNQQILKQQEKLSNDKINENKVFQEISSLKKQINNTESLINQNEKKVSENNQSINEIKKDSKIESSTLIEINEKQSNLKKQLSQNKQKLAAYEIRQNTLNESWIKIEEEIKNINKEKISEVESKNKTERRIDKIEFKRKNLSENIYEKYGLNLAMVETEIDSIKKRMKDLSSSEVNNLRIKLKEMGSVNINAIDDFKELNDRYIELKKNYDDLIESKEDIEETINKLNTTMSNQFGERFIKLNELFSKVFSILFEGGKARLDYQNPDDILNSGIQLFAQPPGKHPKNINLLSGGEKAMTAIALLLTFIQLNPTPFVIIDEIDAALDDNNINRFSRYIQKVKEGNQFIIITHRKGTIQICNNIHGISMSKDGVSRCCSFEISDYLE